MTVFAEDNPRRRKFAAKQAAREAEAKKAREEETVAVELSRRDWEFLLEHTPYFVTAQSIRITDALRRAITNGPPR